MSNELWEIKDVFEDKILRTNLSYEEMKYLLPIYKNDCSTDAVYAFPYEIKNKYKSPEMEFKEEWINYFGVLQEMGNIY